MYVAANMKQGNLLLNGKSQAIAESQTPTQACNELLFKISFCLAIISAIAMVQHAYQARGSGHENKITPALLMMVQILKMPALQTKYKKDQKNLVNRLLWWGTALSGVLWAVAFVFALT